MKPVFHDPARALEDVLQDGLSIMVGGFAAVGVPNSLISAVLASGVRDLTVIANGVGPVTRGVARLVATGQVSRIICSFIRDNPTVDELVAAGALRVELSPQGSLAERIRCGGAGIPAFFTPTGVGTLVAKGKEVREFQGRCHLLEHSLRADLALVKAWRSDTEGNLVFRKSAINFNPIMATAGAVTVAEVDEVMHLGALDPSHVHTPGVFVDRLVGPGTSTSTAAASLPTRSNF